MKPIYKVLNRSEWQRAVEKGHYEGSAVDQADGFIHFSTAEQLVETVSKHFGGQPDLLLVCFDADKLGAELRWEPSRGGHLFPHLYSILATELAESVQELSMLPDGTHVFPLGPWNR